MMFYVHDTVCPVLYPASHKRLFSISNYNEKDVLRSFSMSYVCPLHLYFLLISIIT